MALKREQFVEEIGKMSVLELAELVKELETTFGVSAAAAVAAAPAAVAGAAPAGAAEKTEFKVVLEDGGPEKIKAIKAVRTVTTLGLAEAKAAVEGTPFTLAEAASKADADKIKKAMEEAGAKVSIS